ncbi:FAD-binding protein, partial [Mesorhizobium sp. M2D.F.Ca.ET.145.01.1.1]
TVLDHHPALELLSDGDAIVGAGGVARQAGHDWRVDAKAVVLATGGCAFRERILGGTGLTGDGYLMAAEAGASLSGMEFTGKYTLAPYGSSLNKGLPFR